MPAKSFLCSYCDHMFTTCPNWLKHMKTKHAHTIERNVKNLKCLYCPKMFATLSGRIRHERQCLNCEENPTCSVTSQVPEYMVPTSSVTSEVLKHAMAPTCSETLQVPRQDVIYNSHTSTL